ncbi:MAG: group II intron reverse transcriptase/maturase [Bacteroidota bacterium]
MSVTNHPSGGDNPIPEGVLLIERLVERENMGAAYHRVLKNRGSAGVDGMKVTDLKRSLNSNWLKLKEQLLMGTYKPDAVLVVEIPKDGGGMRKLGIPTVSDRLIQQGLLQILTPVFDPGFSEGSYGFRPGRSAHDAVRQSQLYIREGYNWVVDLDLAKFFDEVPHDVLMGRVRRKVSDKSVLKLVRRYLEAEEEIEGKRYRRQKGVPQGGPLSPLLANILLDDLDKELERRGHRFCRYADDCNIYVRSEKAGKRVKESLTGWLKHHLRLKVNESKSAVDRVWNRSFLGYTFLPGKRSRIKISSKSIRRFKSKIRTRFRMGKGRNLGRFIVEDLNPLVRGWTDYFGLCETRKFAKELDGWLRRRLRKVIWQQSKRNWTRSRRLISRGLAQSRAWKSVTNGRGPWWNAGASHMNQAFPSSFFNNLGLVSILNRLDYWKS